MTSPPAESFEKIREHIRTEIKDDIRAHFLKDIETLAFSAGIPPFILTFIGFSNIGSCLGLATIIGLAIPFVYFQTERNNRHSGSLKYMQSD